MPQRLSKYSRQILDLIDDAGGQVEYRRHNKIKVYGPAGTGWLTSGINDEVSSVQCVRQLERTTGLDLNR